MTDVCAQLLPSPARYVSNLLHVTCAMQAIAQASSNSGSSDAFAGALAQAYSSGDLPAASAYGFLHA